MRLLALETSEYVSSVALWEAGAPVGEQSFPSRMNLCETLTTRIHELLGARPCEAGLSGFAVSQGPGSFTGLRVGVATAKALAHVCELPLVGVSTQQVIAAGAEVEPGTVVCVLQKARQGHVYAGLWERTEAGATVVAPLEVVANAELAQWLQGRSELIIGPGAEAAMDALGELGDDVRVQASLPQAALVAKLGAQCLVGADPAAAYNLQPYYVLASQAERQKNIDLSAGGPTAGRMADGTAVVHAAPPGETATTGPDDIRPLQEKRRITVRRAGLGDLRDIMRIENASFSSPWSEVSIREELAKQSGNLFLTAEVEGEIVGYLGVWIFAGEVHICTVAVSPERRKAGLGELLMLCVLRHAISTDIEYALLEYRVSNHPAGALYSKLGFEYIHTRKRYYQDNGEDAIVAALADLGTASRRRQLEELFEAWLQRHDCEVHVDF
ncbi:MAG: tRNA (adenosine(37)-N6)-threonylcarbamoyltransferase complex dimerization subunit type 1 TsaB [Armatimonadota bacterium]